MRRAALRCSTALARTESCSSSAASAWGLAAQQIGDTDRSDQSSCSTSQAAGQRRSLIINSRDPAGVGAFGSFASSTALHSIRLISTSTAAAAGWGAIFGKKKAASEPQSEQLLSSDDATPDAQPSEIAGFFPLPESSAEAGSAISQACHQVELVSLAAAKADSWVNVAWVMSGFQYFHEAFGLPWWAALAAVNIIMRMITFPMMVWSQKGMARIMAMQADMAKPMQIQQAIPKAATREEQQRLYDAFREEVAAVTAKHGSIGSAAVRMPASMFLNGFVFISIFRAATNLMESKAPSLTDGGMLWFNDLTVSDPYYGLPIVCCLATLAMVEYGIASSEAGLPSGADNRMDTGKMKWFLRVMSFMFIPAGSMVKAGVGVLWVSNSMFAVAQGFLLRSDKFRKSVGMPTVKELQAMSTKAREAMASTKAARPPPPGTPAARIQTISPDELLTQPPRSRKGGR